MYICLTKVVLRNIFEQKPSQCIGIVIGRKPNTAEESLLRSPPSAVHRIDPPGTSCPIYSLVCIILPEVVEFEQLKLDTEQRDPNFKQFNENLSLFVKLPSSALQEQIQYMGQEGNRL